MASNYLSSLSNDDYEALTLKLLEIQNNNCFICENKIDLEIQQKTNIDHIVPLANKGKDTEDNFSVTHESCNKSKQDSNLNIARVLSKLKAIQDEISGKENRPASLKDVLEKYEGSKYMLESDKTNGSFKYSFSEMGANDIQKVNIFKDPRSEENTCFIETPIEYVFHDELINPRGLNLSIGKLIKEFQIGNPQLHLSLARIDNKRLKVFDGQHKAAAQILLGNRKLLLRVFIDPNVDRLIETNTNAGSTLRQIAFDTSIMRQLNNTLYKETVKKYQNLHKLSEDSFDFSEQNLVDYFKGEKANIKKYIIDSIKHSITDSKDNKLKDYIDRDGKSKELPISYSAFNKTFLNNLINSKLILDTSINFKSDEGLNPRELEINQIVKLLNIFAEEIYIGKFIPEVGVTRVEKKIIDKKATGITDEHLVAYRISKEEIMRSWLLYLMKVIENYFANTGKIHDNKKLFQQPFDDQLWINIRNFLINLKGLPLWKDRGMASTVFSGKRNYDYWGKIFETGKDPGGVPVMLNGLSSTEMIKS